MSRVRGRYGVRARPEDRTRRPSAILLGVQGLVVVVVVSEQHDDPAAVCRELGLTVEHDVRAIAEHLILPIR